MRNLYKPSRSEMMDRDDAERDKFDAEQHKNETKKVLQHLKENTPQVTGPFHVQKLSKKLSGWRQGFNVTRLM